MFEVNLYIETTNKQPRAKLARYGYVLEYITPRGNIKTISEGGCENATDNRLTLLAAVRALQRIFRESRITVYTDSKYFYGAFHNGWLPAWKENAWMGSNGKEIKNRDLWEQVSIYAEKHEIAVQLSKEHSFRSLLPGELEKARIDEGEIITLKALQSL